ncbi:Lrp/AsnC family transcriptional regulator [Eubacterium xylanophilum]|uniref:Lrp/AsnC family transcriptional regulator n=1 Tax=Eubacterium xylanophilum TaxID=39497 RepID=UPI0004798265|nr:Lrp/AsnC family transcriptional regulator [Eubacterium xylanophilum]MCR5798180.1 Lrp/AsnC family transcriptional regulator [Eubacterium sp.]
MRQEEILNIISTNSKVSSEDLAAMLNTTKEEIENYISRMESEGIICGYPTLINWDNADNDMVTALIEVKVTPQRGTGFNKIAERIYKFDEVESVYLMSGGFDLTVMIKGRTMKEVAMFVATKLSPMESILSTSTHFVLKKYKEYGLSLVEQGSEDERMLITP